MNCKGFCDFLNLYLLYVFMPGSYYNTIDLVCFFRSLYTF